MIDEENARQLTEKLVNALARSGKEDYRAQLSGLQFSSIDSAGSYDLRPTAKASDARGVLVDAEATDTDGATVFCLLHVKDGALFELEVYRGDSADVKSHLTADSFQVTYPTPPSAP